MLRVGLTGGLGSGKTTVAGMLRELGAHVIESDAVGRRLMEPGQAVYRKIVEHFGPGVVRADGTLDRRRLAELAFEGGRRHELSMIVHPAVIAEQEQWMRELLEREPEAVAVVESALIFEADREGTVPGWRKRFDRVLVVTAPDAVKVARYVARSGEREPERVAAVEADARARISAQIPDEEKVRLADVVLANGASLEGTREAVKRAWLELGREARLQPAAAAWIEERDAR